GSAGLHGRADRPVEVGDRHLRADADRSFNAGEIIVKQEEEVVVISAARSPFGKFGGALKDFTLPKLGGIVAAEAIRRAGISPEDVQEVATGVNLPGGDRSIARQLLIAAGIP